jgi:hypothetical protein
MRSPIGLFMVPIVTVAVLVAQGCAEPKPALSSKPPDPYSLRASVTCLKQRGAIVTSVKPTNHRLRALRDIAQRTSVQIRIGRAVAGLAVGKSTSEGALLYELLQVPNDPLRLERRRNVVLLSPTWARAARLTIIDCLKT